METLPEIKELLGWVFQYNFELVLIRLWEIFVITFSIFYEFLFTFIKIHHIFSSKCFRFCIMFLYNISLKNFPNNFMKFLRHFSKNYWYLQNLFKTDFNKFSESHNFHKADEKYLLKFFIISPKLIQIHFTYIKKIDARPHWADL